MIEHVGHEFMDTFFSHCEAALAEDGIFVLQVTLVSFPHISLGARIIIIVDNL